LNRKKETFFFPFVNNVIDFPEGMFRLTRGYCQDSSPRHKGSSETQY